MKQLLEQHAEGVDVARGVHLFAQRLLGAHVGRRADDRSERRQRRGRGRCAGDSRREPWRRCRPAPAPHARVTAADAAPKGAPRFPGAPRRRAAATAAWQPSPTGQGPWLPARDPPRAAARRRSRGPW